MQETSFIDELLAEAEQKEQALTQAHYDLIIVEIIKLESEIASNFRTAREEAEIINQWALRRNTTLQDRIDFMRLKLEAYIRGEGKKTIDLPHGTLKLYKKPDKIEVSDLEAFIANAKNEIISIIPESIKPDLNKIKSYIKSTGHIPEGINLIQGQESFTLTLKQNGEQTYGTKSKT